MRGIASDVGVSAAALYRHYENRDAILSAIVSYGYDEIGRRMEQPIRADDPCERIVVLALRYVSFALENPGVFDLMFGHQPARSWAYAQGVTKEASRACNVLLREVDHALRIGALREADAGDVARTLWVHAHGFAALRRAGVLRGSRRRMRARARASAMTLIRGLAEPSQVR